MPAQWARAPAANPKSVHQKLNKVAIHSSISRVDGNFMVLKAKIPSRLDKDNKDFNPSKKAIASTNQECCKRASELLGLTLIEKAKITFLEQICIQKI